MQGRKGVIVMSLSPTTTNLINTVKQVKAYISKNYADKLTVTTFDNLSSAFWPGHAEKLREHAIRERYSCDVLLAKACSAMPLQHSALGEDVLFAAALGQTIVYAVLRDLARAFYYELAVQEKVRSAYEGIAKTGGPVRLSDIVTAYEAKEMNNDKIKAIKDMFWKMTKAAKTCGFITLEKLPDIYNIYRKLDIAPWTVYKSLDDEHSYKVLMASSK